MGVQGHKTGRGQEGSVYAPSSLARYGVGAERAAREKAAGRAQRIQEGLGARRAISNNFYANPQIGEDAPKVAPRWHGRLMGSAVKRSDSYSGG